MTKLNLKFKNPKVKRRLASVNGCLVDLKEELPLLFNAFEVACIKYNKEVVNTPPQSRCRGFEASLFNSKLIQCIQNNLPSSWRFGKYKRFILNTKGYLILVKKLNNLGMPMNIKTKIVESINLQMMGSLFEDFNYVEEPILYFGYQKDRIGNIHNPQLVYIDENQVRWTINESSIADGETLQMGKQVDAIATPKIRSTKKKAVNE